VATVVDRHSITATVEPLGITLDVLEATFSLDESRAPYAEMTLTAEFPTASDVDLLDITAQSLRLSGEIRRDFGILWSLATLSTIGGGSVSTITDFGGVTPSSITNRLFGSWNPRGRASQARTFNLYITERVLDTNDRKLTINATSDESVMINDALIAGTSLDPGTQSIPTIVQAVLNRYGATLEPGGSTGTVAEQPATLWDPGVRAWDYLDDFLEAASLRVWADENRRWYLTPRQTVSAGALNISPTNAMLAHKDTMAYNSEVFFDAVVVEYRWTNALNVPEVAYDFAGATIPRCVSVLRHDDTVFPGPGAAQGILDRMTGRGRTIDVDAVSTYTATPGQPVTITPPIGFDQNGFLVSVEWKLPAAQMSVVSRNITTSLVTTWLSPLLEHFTVADLTEIGGGSVADLTAIPGDTVAVITAALDLIATGIEWDQIPASVSWDTFEDTE